jgi:hypothetical protein
MSVAVTMKKEVLLRTCENVEDFDVLVFMSCYKDGHIRMRGDAIDLCRGCAIFDRELTNRTPRCRQT